MDEEEDGTDVVRAACWKLCDAKDLCGSAPLCEGWERETMTGRALEWLTRSMRALPMSLLTETVTSVSRCRRGLICNRLKSHTHYVKILC